MDSTLQQLLRELFSYSQQIDQLRARVAELERLTEQQTRTSEDRELAAFLGGPKEGGA